MLLHTSILIFHVAVGTVSLLSGSIALLTKKGGKVHRKAGKVYYYGMYAVTVSALVMSVIKFNPFLLAIAIFSLYLSYSGIRALKYWRLKEPYIPTPRDKAPYYIALITALFMVLYPVAIMILEGGFFVPILSVFGLIMLPLAWKDIIAHKRPENFAPRNKAWLLNHIGKMSGAYIATFTAFLLNNVTFSPGWVVWLGPTAIGIPLISMAIRKWTKKLSKNTANKSIAIILVLICGSPSLFGQIREKVLKGITIDERGTPLPYVSIGIRNTGYGTISNDKGAFVLYLPPESGAMDSLKVSCIGYELLCIPVSQLDSSAGLTLKMKPAAHGLGETIVRPAKTKKLTRGCMNEGATMNNNFAISSRPGQNLWAEVAEKVFLKGKATSLKKLNMYITRNTFDTVLFRLNIYNIVNGMPGRNLLDEHILWQVCDIKKGWTTVDLESYALVYDKNIIVSVEWVGHSIRGSYLSLPISMPRPGKVHYYKFGSQGKWKRFFGMATSIYLDVERETS